MLTSVFICFSKIHNIVNSLACNTVCFSDIHKAVNNLVCNTVCFSDIHKVVNNLACNTVCFSDIHNIVNSLACDNETTLWARDINQTYIRRSEDVLHKTFRLHPMSRK